MEYKLGPTEWALAPHRLHALYWSMFAPVIYIALTTDIAAATMPLVAEVLSPEYENKRIRWMIYCLPQFAVLIRMMHWANTHDVGPFAGLIRFDQRWVIPAIVFTPIMFIAVQVGSATLLGNGEADWALRDEVDTDFLGAAGFGISMVLFVVVLAPLVEEIGFRGIALGCLLGRGLEPRLAILISAVGFTLLHLQYNIAGLVPVFFMGLYLGWLRVRTGSIAVPIIAHMSANAVPMLLLGVSQGAGA